MGITGGNENAQVVKRNDLGLVKGKETFDQDEGSGFDMDIFGFACMTYKIINRHFDVVPRGKSSEIGA